MQKNDGKATQGRSRWPDHDSKREERRGGEEKEVGRTAKGKGKEEERRRGGESEGKKEEVRGEEGRSKARSRADRGADGRGYKMEATERES